MPYRLMSDSSPGRSVRAAFRRGTGASRPRSRQHKELPNGPISAPQAGTLMAIAALVQASCAVAELFH